MSNETSLGAKVAAEFIGTFLLVFTVGCAVVHSGGLWAGVAIANTLMVLVYCLGGISGANFNPAVSAALAMSKEVFHGPGIDYRTAGLYVIAQFAGGLSAVLMSSKVANNGIDMRPSPSFGWREAMLSEFFYTFLLVSTVMHVAVARRSAPNEYYGLAIGFSLIAGAYSAGPISGGALNPAVALFAQPGWLVLYTIAELFGSVAAVFFFKVTRPDDYGDSPMKGVELLCEFVGTFMLVLTVGLNVLSASPAAAYSIAACLACLIYSYGNISGGHFNPAVTFAIFASGRVENLNIKKSAMYMLAQFAGGSLGGVVYSFIHMNGASFRLGSQGHTHSEIAVAEIIFTGLLCFIVLTVAVSPLTKSKDMFGLAIGACVVVGGYAIGSISGASLNPAVSLGISAADRFKGSDLANFLFYTIAELIGAALATAIFTSTHSEAKQESNAA